MALDTLNLSHALLAFLLFRIAQRIYYFLRGHVHYYTLDARLELSSFFKRHDITHTLHEFTCPRDGVTIKYTRIGNGKRLVLLCNGVGTDLFMWLPLLRALLLFRPQVFTELTLIAPSYRGLFGSDKRTGSSSSSSSSSGGSGSSGSKHAHAGTHKGGGEVFVTMDNCVLDLVDVLADVKKAVKEHKSASQFDTLIGWSLGAQAGLTALASYPTLAHKLVLLNPSSGKTLHSVLQPVVPLPESVGAPLARAIKYLITRILRPLIPTTVWPWLQAIARSVGFRVALEFGSFFGGYPPEQANYFHEYMKDVFQTRNQTRGLLDLIVALDSPCPAKSFTLPNRTHIISGYPDIMTGVYHSQSLAATLPNSTHTMFSMGSHFVLLEWPDLVAREIAGLIFED